MVHTVPSLSLTTCANATGHIDYCDFFQPYWSMLNISSISVVTLGKLLAWIEIDQMLHKPVLTPMHISNDKKISFSKVPRLD